MSYFFTVKTNFYKHEKLKFTYAIEIRNIFIFKNHYF